MKVMKKVLIIAIVLLLGITLMQNTSMATYDWASKINSTATASAPAEANGAINATKSIAQSVITITRAISLGVAITMLIVLAIKYMSAAPGDKASIKKSAVTYVVGAIVMFAAYGILTIIQSFASGIKTTA